MDRAEETRKFIEKVEVLNSRFSLPEKRKGTLRICTFNTHQLRTPLPIDFSGRDTTVMVGNMLRNMEVDVAFLQECPSNFLRNVFPFYDFDPHTQLAMGTWCQFTKLHASTYLINDVIMTNVHFDVCDTFKTFQRFEPIFKQYHTQKYLVAGDCNSTDAVQWFAPFNLHRRSMGITCWAGTEVDFIFTNVIIDKSFIAPVTLSDHLPLVYDIKIR